MTNNLAFNIMTALFSEAPTKNQIVHCHPSNVLKNKSHTSAVERNAKGLVWALFLPT